MLALARSYRKYDPAARSLLEVLLLYPGIRAIFFHRVTHRLWSLGVPFAPRALSELSRWLTGIEIHPGAQLGPELIIDHGMGVVIGETTVIGRQVILYQGVTLGGISLARTKRHPTIGDRVVIGAGAKVLGNIEIGADSRVGANSVVVQSVPAGSTVDGIPARVLSRAVEAGEELNHDFII